MQSPPFRLQYKTIKNIPRVGPWGALCVKVAAHPLRAGAIAGAIAVIIAAIQAPGAIQKDPTFSAVLAALVWFTWIIIIFITRGFFKSQTTEQIDVVRRLEIDEQSLQWSESNKLVRTLQQPTLTFCAIGQPPTKLKDDAPWPVALVFTDAADPAQTFILETRQLAAQARALPTLDPALTPDELLPAHTISPLLQHAKRAAEHHS